MDYKIVFGTLPKRAPMLNSIQVWKAVQPSQSAHTKVVHMLGLNSDGNAKYFLIQEKKTILNQERKIF